MNRQINEIATVRLLQIQYLYKNEKIKMKKKPEKQSNWNKNEFHCKDETGFDNQLCSTKIYYS